MDSFVRPGCTHLTVITIVSPAERELLRTTGAAGLAEQILRRSGWEGAEQQQRAGQGWSRDMLVRRGVSSSQCWRGPGVGGRVRVREAPRQHQSVL